MQRLKSCGAVTGFMMVAMVSGSANAARVCDGFMPENNLHLFDNKKSLAGMTEAEFNRRIDEVEAVYKPIVESHGSNLVFERKWADSTVNAYADQIGTGGKTWSVAMFGGLARRPEVTGDGFSLVICHEVGHHLGGYPFYKASILDPNNWAAAEGQSDYFATQACAKLLWSDDKQENAKSRAVVPAAAKAKCDASFTSEDEQNLCYRTAIAGKSLATLLAALGTSATPDFTTPDTTVVKKTVEGHPEGQCRLDTYVAGAVCGKDFDRTLIPGKNGNRGSNTNAGEQMAEKYSCAGKASSAPGVRPACWFKSRLHP